MLEAGKNKDMLLDKRIKENLASAIIFGNSTKSEQEYLLPNRCDKYDGVTGVCMYSRKIILRDEGVPNPNRAIKVQLTPVK